MSHVSSPPTPRPESAPDSDLAAVFQLELNVARRADELARTHGYDRARDYWMEAEAEIIGRVFFPAA